MKSVIRIAARLSFGKANISGLIVGHIFSASIPFRLLALCFECDNSMVVGYLCRLDSMSRKALSGLGGLINSSVYRRA